MRIAFFVGEFPKISETFVVNQIVGMLERGHEVHIYAATPAANAQVHPDIDKYQLWERSTYDGISDNLLLRLFKGVKLFASHYHKDPATLLASLNIVKYGLNAASLRLLHQVVPQVERDPYDIVHCHFGYNALRALNIRRLGLLKGKLIATFHGVDISRDLNRKGQQIYHHLFEEGDLFLPISEHWKRKLIQLGCEPRKILVHHMGIDCGQFSFLERCHRGTEPIRLVTISRLVEKKGVEYGIRAVAKLAEVDRNIEYRVIGDGVLRKKLQRLIQQLNVGDVVKLLGWRQRAEVCEILNNSDILLAPSVTAKDGDQEGIPVALMEAMATGIPVVSTLHSGIPELVEDGISGFLVSERDVQGLAQKLSELILHPEIRLEMAKAGRQQVESHFNINLLNPCLEKIYQDLLSAS